MTFDNEKAKAYAFDKIMEHLEDSKDDRRHKERMRVKIARRHITEWYNEYFNGGQK